MNLSPQVCPQAHSTHFGQDVSQYGADLVQTLCGTSKSGQDDAR